MSNISGKAYAMNVVTPIKLWMTPINKLIFWAAGTYAFSSQLLGLRFYAQAARVHQNNRGTNQTITFSRGVLGVIGK